MNAGRCTPALLLAAALAGCASMRPGEGLSGVQQEVAARTGVDARWDRGTEEDARARAAVQGLLEHELTPQGAVQVALLNNRDLRATYEELDLAQADLVRAGLLRNPVFSGELRFDTEGGGTGIVLDLTGEFLSLLTMPLRTSRAGSAYTAAKARVTRAAVAVAFDTQAAFYEYQAAEEAAALREHVREAAEASSTLAQRLYEAGNTRELDALSERALAERAALDAESARERVAQARERLNTLMGVWGADTGWHAAARLPDPPETDSESHDLERRAVAASLELAEARAEVDAAAAGARLARPLAWLEGSDVGVAAEREVEGGWSVGPSLSVPIPIFDNGSVAEGEAGARLRQAADRYYAAAVRVRAQARENAAVLASARARLTRLRTAILPLHEKIVERTQLQYNAMQVSGFQLLQAKREQIDAAVLSVEAARDYWVARAGVLRLAGGATVSPADRSENQQGSGAAQSGQGAHR